jgi:hypothetical protein
MQITRRNKHGVKLRYLLELIHALECKKVFPAKGVEINFIVPRKNLATYKIGRIESPRIESGAYFQPPSRIFCSSWLSPVPRLIRDYMSQTSPHHMSAFQ